MRLFDRLSVLLRADAHGVVESLEERTLLLKQYLREGELEVDRTRARLGVLRDQHKTLSANLTLEQEAETRLDEDVTLALDAGKDDLARFAIKQLLPRRRALATLAAKVEECCTQIGLVETRLQDQERRFVELKSRVQLETAHRDDPQGFSFQDVSAVADEEVEIELMRRRSGEEVS